MRQPPLIWKSANGIYRVTLHRRCFLKIRRMAIARAPIETGTTLVGYYAENGHRAVITNIGPLSVDSKGTPTSYMRGVIGLFEYFTRLHRRFRGDRYRIGEWHSHPSGEPSPSDIDDSNQAALAKDEREKLPQPILLIIGGEFHQKPLLSIFAYSQTCGRVSLHPECDKPQ